ncbi:bifunctional hydroxymethylpyrimidine kinase/phosphomethylpyrimidine kinase [Advenella sp. RU8]|uniref:bifunctional hydroxymethylpyrimidine kinase/phosphomethylpyrimidine kinase n=1 Tax=Advenella sp. RU8 TaxID=3399575 RepID=UPI003AAF4346
MSNSLPATVLFFNVFDPSGRSGLPAGAITANRLECHPLATITALAVQDTVAIESIHPVDPEVLNNQARCLLEDCAVQAINANGFCSTETVSIIAQIAADYDTAPLVVYLGKTFFNALNDPDPEDIEDIINAVKDLLLPQAHTVVLDHTYINQWAGEDHTNTQDFIQDMLGQGTRHCLLLGQTANERQTTNTLYSQDSSQLVAATYPNRHPEAGDIVSAAICCYLAKGLPVLQASEKAIQYAHSILEHCYPLGMGKPMPNQFDHD